MCGAVAWSVLVGLGLRGEHDASWLIRTLRERFPAHAILGCGANTDATTISRALFMGADGFVDKNIDPVEFLQSLRRAADREMVLAGPAPGAVGQIADGIERHRDLEVRLTEREREVLSVAAEGLTAREIAIPARGSGTHGHDPPRPHLRQARRRQPARRDPHGHPRRARFRRCIRRVRRSRHRATR